MLGKGIERYCYMAAWEVFWDTFLGVKVGYME